MNKENKINWLIETPDYVKPLNAELPWDSFCECTAALCSNDDPITAFSDVIFVIGNVKFNALTRPYITWEISIDVRMMEIVLTVNGETYFRNPHLEIARITYFKKKPCLPVGSDVVHNNNAERGRLRFQIAESEINSRHYSDYRSKNAKRGKRIFDKFKILHVVKRIFLRKV